MAKSKRSHRRHYAHSSNRRHRRHHNPFLRRRRHHRNPMGQTASDILKLGGGAFAGALGSGYATQIVLGSGNVGVVGYIGDAVSTLVLAWAANKFLGQKVAEGVLAGGFGALIKRVYQENVSGSVAMSGLGNRDFLGLYTQRNYVLPTATQGGSYQLQAGPGTPVAASPAQIAAGVVADGKAAPTLKRFGRAGWSTAAGAA